MNFQDAESRFQALERKWASGKLDHQAYAQLLANLQVIDSAGDVWMLQQHTGRWFVFRDGAWVDGQRVAGTAWAKGENAGRKAASAQPPAPTTTGRGKGKVALLVIIGVMTACLACAALGTSGYLVYSGKIPLPSQLSGLLPQSSVEKNEQEAGSASEQAAPDVGVKQVEVVQAAPDNSPHTDSHGVSLTAPEDALEDGGAIYLSALELDSPWRVSIEPGVSIDTPFYSLAAQGKNDTPGSLTLSFPAGKSQSRLLAVIDNEYLVELAQVPQDGRLVLQTRAAPSDTSEMTPPEGYDGTGSIYYAVITPKSSSQLPGGVQMASWTNQADERNCIPDLSIIGGAAVNLCRQNLAGTVQVMLPTTLRDLLPQVDLMVDKIEAVMNKYYNQGFTTAQLSHRSPMLVRVSPKVTSPSYYPLNGVLYIPVDTVSRIATLSPTDLYHEMAHWIQAVKYSTRLAYWSGEKTWWLETSAENMVMLVEPGYVSGNLTTYGTISNSDNSLAFQSSPYQWPGDYYVQAQLLKVNLCDSPACALSQSSFAKAINEGTYPLMDGGRKSLVSGNLKDYAFYLLGKSPSSTNTAIPLSGPVKTGEGYGEYVRITRNSSVDLKYDFNGSSPQMSKENKDGIEAVAIQAKILRDGVYPFMLLGGDGGNPGLPVELDIEPGAPFYYTLDDGELKYSDGSQELKILPVHGQMGIKKVRIVAIGETGSEVFSARVKPLDLQGAWVVVASGQKTGGSMTCNDDSVDNPDGTSILMAYVLEMVSGMGDMVAEPTGRSLDWNIVPDRVPVEFSEDGVTFRATALQAGDGIKYQANVDIPKEEDGASLPPLTVVPAVLLVPFFWLRRKQLKALPWRTMTNAVVIVFLALISSGCFGMGMYGSATLDARFDKIEYVGGQDTGMLMMSNEMNGITAGSPIWKLTGSGTYDVSFSIEATTTDQDGVDTTTTTVCTGSITYPVSAFIYEDVVVQMPPEEE